MAVAADPESTATVEVPCRIEEAVAQVCFRRRTQPGDRAAPGEAYRLDVVHVSRMYDAPSLVDAHFIEQPFDRPLPAAVQAVLHFPHLFRRMNVNGCTSVERGHHLHDRSQLGMRHGAKRMWSHADTMVRSFVQPRGKRRISLVAFIPSPGTIVRAPGQASSVWTSAGVLKARWRKPAGFLL